MVCVRHCGRKKSKKKKKKHTFCALLHTVPPVPLADATRIVLPISGDRHRRLSRFLASLHTRHTFYFSDHNTVTYTYLITYSHLLGYYGPALPGWTQDPHGSSAYIGASRLPDLSSWEGGFMYLPKISQTYFLVDLDLHI